MNDLYRIRFAFFSLLKYKVEKTQQFAALRLTTVRLFNYFSNFFPLVHFVVPSLSTGSERQVKSKSSAFINFSPNTISALQYIYSTA